MKKPLAEKYPKVFIGDHAWKRWQERGWKAIKKKQKLSSFLAAVLDNRMKSQGVQVVGNLEVILDLSPKLRAHVGLFEEGWGCNTIIFEDEVN